MKNFPTSFWSEFTRHKDSLAFVGTEPSDDVTFWVWTRAVQKLAVGLMDAGLGSGERIGIVSNDRQAFFDYAFAAWLSGGVVVPIPAGRDRSETLKRLARAGCEWIVVDTKEDLRRLIGTDGKVPDTLHWIVVHEKEELPDATTDATLREQGKFRAKRGDLDKLAKRTFGIDPSEPRLILSTFDLPLHACTFSDKRLNSMLENLHQTLGWEEQRVALKLSLGWFYGCVLGVYALFHGNALVAGKNSDELSGHFHAAKPTTVVTGSATIAALTEEWADALSKKAATDDPKTFGDLFRAMGASAMGSKIRKDISDRFGKELSRVYVVDRPASEGVHDVFQQADVDVLSIWGRPEIGISHAEVPDGTRQGSVGRPIYGYTTNLKKTKSGEVGPLQIRANSLMDRYWEVDGDVVMEGEWLTLPTQARVESGFLHLESKA